MTRSETREQAFILIFESLFREDTVDEIVELAGEIDDFKLNADVISLFKETSDRMAEICTKIEKYSEKRQIKRIPKVNLAIIALAVYEMDYGNIPVNVAISEAVLIAKKYTYENDVAFINGVLGSYARDRENA